MAAADKKARKNYDSIFGKFSGKKFEGKTVAWVRPDFWDRDTRGVQVAYALKSDAEGVISIAKDHREFPSNCPAVKAFLKTVPGNKTWNEYNALLK